MSAASPPIARTPLDAWHKAHGARFTDDNGWQVPVGYSSVEREAAAARAGVGLADISAFAKISLLGPGLDALSQPLLGRSKPLKPLSTASFEASGPVLACRLTSNHLLLLASTTSAAALENRLASLQRDANLVQTDVSSALAGFALVGPRTEEVLRQLTSLDVSLSSLPEGSCAETNLAGIQALLIRQVGTTLPALRAYVSWDLAEHAWEELVAVGRSCGLMVMGAECWAALMA